MIQKLWRKISEIKLLFDGKFLATVTRPECCSFPLNCSSTDDEFTNNAPKNKNQNSFCDDSSFFVFVTLPYYKAECSNWQCFLRDLNILSIPNFVLFTPAASVITHIMLLLYQPQPCTVDCCQIYKKTFVKISNNPPPPKKRPKVMRVGEK